MENELMKSPVAEKYLPAKVNLQQLQKIDEVSADFFAVVGAGEKSPAVAILRAAVMQQLRDLLTDDVMKPIMALQGNKLGFLTDRDRRKGPGGYVKGDGYPLETVRDTVIWAAGNGARMVGNEVNIIAGNGYLTREYFGRKLDEVLGAENWSVIPEVPRVTRTPDGKTGALVTGKIRWRDSAGEHAETLQLAIKGDEYAGTDSYLGKFERKSRKFLLERCTRRRYSDGASGAAVDCEATDLPDLQPEEPTAGDEERLAAELTRRGEAVTVSDLREFAVDSGCEFDPRRALERLDDILAVVRTGGK